jgi:hypothetical protein
VGRTNLIILVLGALGCTAMFLALRDGLQLKEKLGPSVTQEIHTVFGHRLSARPALRLIEEDGGRCAVLTIEPRLALAGARHARTIGEHAWTLDHAAGWDRLRVVVLDGERTSSFDIPGPLRGAKSRSSGSLPAKKAPAQSGLA